MQKKQKRPRSRRRPRLTPIKSEIGAVPAFSPLDRKKARIRRAEMIANEIAVRIFSRLLHAELEDPSESEPPAAW
jgi:hypothetical protein